MTEQQDGPPGPEETEVVDVEHFDETIAVVDNYKRRNDGAKVASLLNDVLGETVLDASQYTDAWWSQREQELANERAKKVALVERERMRARAEMLVHVEGNGMRCRFPQWAVERARNTTLDTDAMRHSRRFLHALEIELTARSSQIVGDRDPDDRGEPAPRILVLAGGTGGGKTTAATWIALKGMDQMPGFIRASELERRGRYDKDLRGWIPERTSLVIDDIGAELLDGKAVFKSFLDEIVDTFYSSRRRLILTTNLKPKIDDAYRDECKRNGIEPEPQFRERYGERVRSRIVQVGQWSECGNVDLRTEPR